MTTDWPSSEFYVNGSLFKIIQELTADSMRVTQETRIGKPLGCEFAQFPHAPMAALPILPLPSFNRGFHQSVGGGVGVLGSFMFDEPIYLAFVESAFQTEVLTQRGRG